MSDRWVNARIEIVVPLDTVTVEASPAAKIAEATGVYEELIADLPERWRKYITTVEWKDVSDD